jgi:hypothetical protein
MKKRKVGIVGAAIDPDALIERGKGFELWSVNNLYSAFEYVKFARWYELHDFAEEDGVMTRRGFPNYPLRSEQTVARHLERIDELKIPVYMQREWPNVRKSRVFPFADIQAKWGNYFGCSFTWMVAHALLEGVDELGFFGVTLDGHEYYYQRPSLERMIGYAEGIGVRITVDETSNMLKAGYVYAIGEDYGLIYTLHGELMRDLAQGLSVGIQQELERVFTGRVEIKL